MSKKTFIPLVFILLVRLSFGQNMEVFDYKLYSEKLTLCDLTSKFIDLNKNFKYTHFDTSFYSVSSYDNQSKIFGNWTFVSRHDSLNQIGFTSLDLAITAEWFKILYGQADTLIKTFTIKYGKPIKTTNNEKNYYQKNKKFLSGDIISAMWITDGQKLKVDFIIDGEHNNFHYVLRIQKFKDYYGNTKLPEWWDGY